MWREINYQSISQPSIIAENNGNENNLPRQHTEKKETFYAKNLLFNFIVYIIAPSKIIEKKFTEKWIF